MDYAGGHRYRHRHDTRTDGQTVPGIFAGIVIHGEKMVRKWELWEMLGKEGFTYEAAWPVFNPDLVVEDTVTIAIQVNGKLRGKITVPAGSDQKTLEATARADEHVAKMIEGKTIVKVIVVPGRLVNIVVG